MKKTIEKDSIETKNLILFDLVKNTRFGDKTPKIFFVRGKIIKQIDMSLLNVCSSQSMISTIIATIQLSKYSKNSRHQIDYIITSMVEESRQTVKDVSKFTNQEEIKNLIKEERAKVNEMDLKENLMVFVLSENETDMLTYDIISSTNSEELVMSPEPTTKINGSDKSMFTLMTPGGDEFRLDSFFKSEKKYQSLSKEEIKSIENIFKNDKRIFEHKSKFIKKRDEKLNKTKKENKVLNKKKQNIIFVSKDKK